MYAHVDDAVRVNTSVTPYAVTRLPCAEKSFVHQVRFCSLGDTVLIVVASDNGLQVRALLEWRKRLALRLGFGNLRR